MEPSCPHLLTDFPPETYRVIVERMIGKMRAFSGVGSYMEDYIDLENSHLKGLIKVSQVLLHHSRTEELFPHFIEAWENARRISIAGRGRYDPASSMSKMFPDFSKSCKKSLQGSLAKTMGMLDDWRRSKASHDKLCERYERMILEVESCIRARDSTDVGEMRAASLGGDRERELSGTQKEDGFMNRSITKMLAKMKPGEKKLEDRIADLLRDIEVAENGLTASVERLNSSRAEIFQEIEKNIKDMESMERSRIQLLKESWERMFNTRRTAFEYNKKLLEEVAEPSVANIDPDAVATIMVESVQNAIAKLPVSPLQIEHVVTPSTEKLYAAGTNSSSSGSNSTFGSSSSTSSSTSSTSVGGIGAVGGAAVGSVGGGLSEESGIHPLVECNAKVEKTAEVMEALRLVSMKVSSVLSEVADVERAHARSIRRALDKTGYKKSLGTQKKKGSSDVSGAAALSTGHTELHMLLGDLVSQSEEQALFSCWFFNARSQEESADAEERTADLYTEDLCTKLQVIQHSIEDRKRELSDKLLALTRSYESAQSNHQKSMLKLSKVRKDLRERRQTVRKAEEETETDGGGGGSGASAGAATSGSETEDSRGNANGASDLYAAASTAGGGGGAMPLTAVAEERDSFNGSTNSSSNTSAGGGLDMLDSAKKKSAKIVERFPSIGGRKLSVVVGLETQTDRILRIKQRITALEAEEKELEAGVEAAAFVVKSNAERVHKDLDAATHFCREVMLSNVSTMKNIFIAFIRWHKSILLAEQAQLETIEGAVAAVQADECMSAFVSSLNSTTQRFSDAESTVNLLQLPEIVEFTAYTSETFEAEKMQLPPQPQPVAVLSSPPSLRAAHTSSSFTPATAADAGVDSESSAAVAFAQVGVVSPDSFTADNMIISPLSSSATTDGGSQLQDLPLLAGGTPSSALSAEQGDSLNTAPSDTPLSLSTTATTALNIAGIASAAVAALNDGDEAEHSSETPITPITSNTSSNPQTAHAQCAALTVSSNVEENDNNNELLDRENGGRQEGRAEANRSRTSSETHALSDDGERSRGDRVSRPDSSKAPAGGDEGSDPTFLPPAVPAPPSVSSPSQERSAVARKAPGNVLVPFNSANPSSSSSFPSAAENKQAVKDASLSVRRSTSPSSPPQAPPQTGTANSAVAAIGSKADSSVGSELKKFGLLPTDKVIESFSCAFYPKKGLLNHGRMFITQRYMAFSGWPDTRVLLSLRRLTSIEKSTTLKYIPNAISIVSNDGIEYFFGSFIDRDYCYNLLKSISEVEKRITEIHVEAESAAGAGGNAGAVVSGEGGDVSDGLHGKGFYGDGEGRLEFGLQTRRVDLSDTADGSASGGSSSSTSNNNSSSSSITTAFLSSIGSSVANLSAAAGATENAVETSSSTTTTGIAGTTTASNIMLTSNSVTSAFSLSRGKKQPFLATIAATTTTTSSSTSTSANASSATGRGLKFDGASVPAAASEAAGAAAVPFGATAGLTDIHVVRPNFAVSDEVDEDDGVDFSALFSGNGISFLDECIFDCQPMEMWSSCWLYGRGYRDFLVEAGEESVSIGEWQSLQTPVPEDVSRLPFTFTRRCDYAHPRTSMLMFGPKNAQAAQRQYLYLPGAAVSLAGERSSFDSLQLRKPWRGAVLTITQFTGIPMSDVFKVMQYWSFEQSAQSNLRCVVKVGCAVHFDKSTILKGQIAAGTKEELAVQVKKWFAYAGQCVLDLQKDIEEEQNFLERASNHSVDDSTVMASNVARRRGTYSSPRASLNATAAAIGGGGGAGAIGGTAGGKDLLLSGGSSAAAGGERGSFSWLTGNPVSLFLLGCVGVLLYLQWRSSSQLVRSVAELAARLAESDRRSAQAAEQLSQILQRMVEKIGE